MSLHKVAKRESKLRVDNLVTVEVQLFEQRLIDLASASIRRSPVQLIWSLEQTQRGFQQVDTGGHATFDIFQPTPNLLALAFDCPQLLANLLLGTRIFSSKVNKVRLLRVESPELCRELLTHQPRRRLLICERLEHDHAHGRDELRCEANRLIEVDDRFLSNGNVDVWLLAFPLLPTPTEVVVILASVSLRTLQDQTTVSSRPLADAAP